jgi:hypothetical protein
MAVSLAAAPAFAQTAQPQARGETAETVPETAETPIGTEAFAEEPAVDLTAARGVVGPARMTFRIATWHLGAKTAKTTAAAQARRPARPASTWRHTFGSERHTARWRKLAEAGFAADIVALQGVKSPGDARRLFPARHYHVVVSRQLLARSGARSTGIALIRGNAPETTAVAYRRQRGVRLAGFRHFLPDAARTRRGEPEVAAITAFRLRIYGKLMWVVSVDLRQDCAAGDDRAICRQAESVLAAFKDWIDQLKGGSAPLIVLGRWPDAAKKVLDEGGFRLIAGPAEAGAACNPQSSGVLIAMPPQPTALKASIEAQTRPAGGNACAHLANVTVHLREGE